MNGIDVAQENTASSDPLSQASDAEFNAFDVGLALASNIKKLILIPLLVGASVYGLTTLSPKSYTSVAVLKNPSTTLDPKVQASVRVTSADALMRTAGVLDKVVAQFPLPGTKPGERRAALERKITIIKLRGEQAATLSVTDANPEMAQKIANAIIAAWFPLAKPSGVALKKLEEIVKANEKELSAIETTIKSTEAGLGSANAGEALAALYGLRRDNIKELIDNRALIQGESIEELVLSGPTLPDDGQNTLRFLGPVAAFLAALGIAAYSILKSMNANRGPNGMHGKKVDLIRAALTPWGTKV
jgi:capsular polysaccharide biosynthesis protein